MDQPQALEQGGQVRKWPGHPAGSVSGSGGLAGIPRRGSRRTPRSVRNMGVSRGHQRRGRERCRVLGQCRRPAVCCLRLVGLPRDCAGYHRGTVWHERREVAVWTRTDQHQRPLLPTIWDSGWLRRGHSGLSQVLPDDVNAHKPTLTELGDVESAGVAVVATFPVLRRLPRRQQFRIA